MKVVLFCGGQGLRLREYSDVVPKPMVPVGYRPILWHLMKYYAHYGHKDFVLCLGHRADYIKEYFLNYQEAVSNDFVLRQGGREVQMLNNDISDWTITFVDTGTNSNIGQRLVRVKEHLKGEEMFLANYADNVTDAPLDKMIEHLRKQPDKVASCVLIKPCQTFHVFDTDESGNVNGIRPVSESNIWANGGFFVFRQEFFKYINEGEEIVNEPFARLIKANKLTTYKWPGFWACMDTFKEKQTLEDSYGKGTAPWQVWKNGDASVAR
jgi:glucose-1-phosphate cytidylyltransferase